MTWSSAKSGASAVGAPGRARHALPRLGGPSPEAGRARPGVDALTRRIRALPDDAISALTWDQRSEMARHQSQGRRPRRPGVFFAHPQSFWERGTNENTNRLMCRYLPKGTPSPATNPTSTPSPTNSTTATAPLSTTSPHKKHSSNSLPPPLDATRTSPSELKPSLIPQRLHPYRPVT